MTAQDLPQMEERRGEAAQSRGGKKALQPLLCCADARIRGVFMLFN